MSIQPTEEVHAMMTRIRRLTLVALVVALSGARPALAQEAAAAEVTPKAAAPQVSNAPMSSPTQVAGPTLDAARAGVRPLAHASAETAAPAAAAQKVGRPLALMIVGFGALLAGAIIGDDVGTIFMVGGALIGLVGLYEYLK
jgi:hypothetical protein